MEPAATKRHKVFIVSHFNERLGNTATCYEMQALIPTLADHPARLVMQLSLMTRTYFGRYYAYSPLLFVVQKPVRYWRYILVKSRANYISVTLEGFQRNSLARVIRYVSQPQENLSWRRVV